MCPTQRVDNFSPHRLVRLARKRLCEIDIEANTVHGSDSDENAAIGIAFFFDESELVG